MFHLHGRTGITESLVLTEDDYFDFLVATSKEPNPIPPRIQHSFTHASLLFLGYRLTDLEFRVLLRSLKRSLKLNPRRHVSAQVVGDEPAIGRGTGPARQGAELPERLLQVLSNHYLLGNDPAVPRRAQATLGRRFQKMPAEAEPYVGPRFFRREDQSIFFGRSREANELLSLVISHSVVLLYAQSGAGKTSLINAKLEPLLEGRRARGASHCADAHRRSRLGAVADRERLCISHTGQLGRRQPSGRGACTHDDTGVSETTRAGGRGGGIWQTGCRDLRPVRGALHFVSRALETSAQLF